MSSRRPSVVVIGGGTGSSTVLESLLPYDFELTAIPTVMDNGGSTGRLRQNYPGLVGVGDIRQCMRTLAQDQQAAERLDQRTPDGHALGNLELVSTALSLGGVNHIEEAIGAVGQDLALQGQVAPVSLDNSNVHLRFPDGEEIWGEINITTYTGNIKDRLGKLTLTACTNLNPRADDAIRNADLKIIAPGNFYGSIIPCLLTKGIQTSLKASAAPLVMVGNLEETENTKGFTPSDYLAELKRHTGITPDIFLANQRGLDAIIEHTRLVRANLLSDERRHFDPKDTIAHTRSRVRHCSQTLGSLIAKELQKIA